MSPKLQKSLSTLGLVVLALAVGAAAITKQSFWMDEGSAAFKALMPDFKTWWKMNLELEGSDVQMPIYMISLWAWEKVMGNTEYALRAINLPFLVLMVVALRNVRFWPLVCLTSPFVLYYVGELRPYTMQMAGGAIAAAALIAVARGRKGSLDGLHALLGAALFLCLSSLSAVIWAGGLALGAIVIRPDWLKAKGFWLRSLLWSPPFLAIGAFYAWTLLGGYGAAAHGGSILSIGFAAYEMIGLLGLGPSRNELRSSPAAILPQLAWLLPAAACLCAAWCLGIRKWFSENPARNILGAACATLLPILALAIIGILMDFRVLGRHLSPVIPAFLLPIAICFGALAKNKAALAFASLAVLIGIASTASLRFQEKHARDDFREATNIASKAITEGKAVLWQADLSTPCYYAYRKGGVPAFHWMLTSLKSEAPSSYMFADLVVIHRPDIGYSGQDHEKILKEAAFDLKETLTGFEIWKNRYSP
ncbi:hypothetical protein HZ994_07410 [Akkermansiaceae bacterium]|nr:hypothetical protein HZ994_07410 [Akkermansiaceae bacterium]